MNEIYEIDEETMEACNLLDYYDKNRKFPKKIRIDITLSNEAIEKLKDKNRSEFINNLIMKQ